MSHVGLAIDPATNDVFLEEDGNLAFVYDAEAVGQHGRQRLKTFRGEWFLDTTAGVPWLDQLMGKRFNPALGEALVKAELLETDGITGISSFSVSFDNARRNLIIREIEVTTTYDEEVLI
jgi:hypothetical protein